MITSDIPWLHPGREVTFSDGDLIPPEKIVQTIVKSVRAKTPLSLVRVGDGELSVMAQDLALPSEYLAKSAAWSSTDYCGVCLRQDRQEGYKMRNRCIEAIKSADLVGVFPRDPFTDKVFSAAGFKPQKVFYAFCNLNFCADKDFAGLIAENPPLLVGSLAKDFAGYLREILGVRVPGAYTEIGCPEDIEKTVAFMKSTPHDWSLVSAGVNADVIASLMAKEYGKVCLDFGQGMDVYLNPKFKGQYRFWGH